jgi:hypothetical protein
MSDNATPLVCGKQSSLLQCVCLTSFDCCGRSSSSSFLSPSSSSSLSLHSNRRVGSTNAVRSVTCRGSTCSRRTEEEEKADDGAPALEVVRLRRCLRCCAGVSSSLSSTPSDSLPLLSFSAAAAVRVCPRATLAA